MTTRSASLAGAAACALFAAGSAIAQTSTPATAAAADEAPDRQVEDIVVTARRIAENVQDIPVAVTALSGDTLARENVREIRDLAGKAPNLTITQGSSDPGSQTVALRGQAAPDLVLTTDPAVGLYVDNILLPRSYGLRAAMIDVQRLEVLRGPQGTLFGKNTTGGLVNVVTNDPKDSFGLSLDSALGNYAAYDFTGILNVPLGETMGLRFVGHIGHHDPYGRDGNGVGLAKDDDRYLRGKFRAEWGALTVNAFADYSSIKSGGAVYKLAGLVPATATAPEGGVLARETALELFGVANPTTLAQAATVLRTYIGGDFYRTGGTFPSPATSHAGDVGLDLQLEVTDDIKIRSISGYRYLRFLSPLDLDGTPFTGTHPRRAANDRFYSQELQLLGGDGDFNWVTGVYLSKEDGSEFSTTISAPRLLNPTRLTTVNRTDGDISGNSVAGFGQFNWRFAEKFVLTAGGRYTREVKKLTSFNRTENLGVTITCAVPVILRSDPAVCRTDLRNTFTQPTYTASLTYSFTDDISSYAKFSHGFRSGGQNYRGSGSVEAFQPFKPEKVDEYEVGLKTELFDRSLRLNFAGFYDQVKDVQRSVIIAVPSTGQTATIQTNAAKATIKGIEAEGTWRVTEGLTLNGSFGVIDPQYKSFVDLTGDRSGEDWPTPKIQYNLSATYAQPLSIGRLSGTMTWTGKSKQNLQPASKLKDQVTQEAYGLLSGRLSLDLDAYDATIALFGRNLLDRHYHVAAVGLESIGFNTVISGEPRTYGIQLTKRFGGGV